MALRISEFLKKKGAGGRAVLAGEIRIVQKLSIACENSVGGSQET